MRRVGGRTAERPAFDALLREWRQRRRVSQLDLAISADVSARHVSFLETGRSRPSREMVLRLAERLDVPLRDRNPLLLAAGFAPSYPRRALDDPAMTPVREAVGAILAGYEPYPALVVDRGWNLVAANAGVGPLTAAAAAHLREPPVNVLRLSLHPDGLPRIVNLAQWRGHVLGRLGREAAAAGDDGLAELLRELTDYPGGDRAGRPRPRGRGAAADPARRPGAGLPRTVTTFGTALDITAAELSIEAFLPADANTAAALRSQPGPGSWPAALLAGRAAGGPRRPGRRSHRQSAGETAQRRERRHERVVQLGEERQQGRVDRGGGRVRAYRRRRSRTRSAATSIESIRPRACMPSSAAPKLDPSCPAGNRTGMPSASARICRHSGLRAKPPLARISRTSLPAARIEPSTRRELLADPLERGPDQVLAPVARGSARRTRRAAARSSAAPARRAGTAA